MAKLAPPVSRSPRTTTTWPALESVFADHGATAYAALASACATARIRPPEGHPLAVLQMLRRASFEGRATDPWSGNVAAFDADLRRLDSPVDVARRTGPVQLTEPLRMAHLLPGLLLAAAGHPGRPLRLIEVGACAGLLLAPERYVVNYPRGVWRTADSEVALTSSLDVPPHLLDVGFAVEDRVGVDLDPVDPSDPATTDRLRAFVWPGEPERERRLRAAVAAAAAAPAPPSLLAGDAVALLPDLLAERVGPDCVTVVVDSGMSAYLAPRDALRLGRALDAAAGRGPLLLLSKVGAEPARTRLPSAWRLVDLRHRTVDEYAASDLLSERSQWLLPAR